MVEDEHLNDVEAAMGIVQQESRISVNAPQKPHIGSRYLSESGSAFNLCRAPSPVPTSGHHVPAAVTAETTVLPLEQPDQHFHTSSNVNANPQIVKTTVTGTTPEASQSRTTQEAGEASEISFNLVLASRLPIRESLGLSGSFNIIGGSAVVLGLLGILMFLWFGHGTHEAADATWAWRQIALQGRMTQAVTLISLALWFIVSMQSAVCTSMLAALVLEKRFARKSHVAWFSVIRSTNDGPLKMVRMMLSSKYLTRHVEFWVLSLLALTTLGLQFSSTILLSDFSDFIIVGDVHHTRLPALLDNISPDELHIVISPGYYSTEQPTYAVIGEIDTNFDTAADARGLSQTGLIQRAFLPLSEKDNRTSVRYLRANAMVMEMNIACMQPHITDMSLIIKRHPDGTTTASVEGRLQYELSIHNAQVDTNTSCVTGNCDEVGFICGVPRSYLDNSEISQSVACIVGVVGNRIDTSILRPKWNYTQAPWSKNTLIYLIISTNIAEYTQSQSLDPFPSSPKNSEWRSYEVRPGQFLNISLCLPAFTIDRKLVTMAASWDLKEPTTQWSLASDKHNTSDVQRYMGLASPRGTFADRNILEMHILGEPDDGPPASSANKEYLIDVDGTQRNISSAVLTAQIQEWSQYIGSLNGGLLNTTFLLCLYCSIGIAGITDTESSLVFSDVIAQTNRAVNALFSFYATKALTVYYAYLSSYKILQGAQIASTTVVRAPKKCAESGCGGLVAVTALLGVHLLYVAVITALYTTQIRHSRFANIWHAVSQLMGGETSEILEAANNNSDDGVFKGKEKEKEDKDDFVRLVKLENGRIEIVKHHLEKKSWGPSWVTKLKEKIPTMKWSKRNESKKRF
ncbi:hypothetical protein CHU98_g4651 [Xylaria longipes]|nr:hypothetical protein CHU98_g4651 [Xylaria longipes]